MPINLQGSGPIVEGWGPPPQLHAPEIGSLVHAILSNRLGQQKLTQESIADTIKNLQSQRQSSAFGEALKNAGIVYPGVDVSGMSSHDLALLAQNIQAQTPDTDLDALHQAEAEAARARAGQSQTISDYIKQYGAKPGTARPGVDYSEHAVGDMWIDEDTGIRMIMTSTGPKQAAGWSQPTDVRGQSQQQQLQEENKLLQRKGDLEGQIATERQANIDAKRANVPYSRADEYNRLVKRLGEIQQGQTTPAPSSTTPGPAAPQTVVPQEPQKPVTPGEKIDPTTAQQYLVKAQGNRAVAQRQAQSDGWTW